MDHEDHKALIQDGIHGEGGTWADFGSGKGAFTLALADLIGKTGIIHSIDKKGKDLKAQQQLMEDRFPQVMLHYHVADFTEPLDLPPLDGIVMANALHFVKKKGQVSMLRQLKKYLADNGRLIIVEYNFLQENKYIPHPIPLPRWEQLAKDAGFGHAKILVRRPSSTWGELYSAIAW